MRTVPAAPKRASPRRAPAPSHERGRDALLAAICHDLRAPLASVTMGANFVLQTMPDEPENARSRRILEAMLRSCAQMERLVRNFADMSEVESGGVALRLGQSDAAELAEIAARAAEGAASAADVALEVARPEAPVIVECDRDRVVRALGHLLANALAVAPAGSTVTLAVTDAGHRLVGFRVVDRGPGISLQVRRHLFDREWHAKRKNRGGGGFGLSIARGFALAHGGKLLVETRPGETTFTFAIPKDGPNATVSAPPPRPRRSRAASASPRGSSAKSRAAPPPGSSPRSRA